MGTIQGEDWPESYKDAFPVCLPQERQKHHPGNGKKYHIWSKQEVLLQNCVKCLQQNMMKLFNRWLTSCDVINLHMEGLLELMKLNWIIARVHFCACHSTAQFLNLRGLIIFFNFLEPQAQSYTAVQWKTLREMFATTPTNESHSALHSSFLLMQSWSHLVLLLS